MAIRILIVDDDPSTRILVENILASKGYQTLTARDGLEALTMIKADKPDLVVLDIMMPEINGYDVCYQLRFNDEFEKLPIVLLSKRDNELDEDIGQKTNIEFVPKPIKPQILLKTIETLLESQ